MVQFVLAKTMLEAIKMKGHNSIFIYGPKGAGKSTLALLYAFKIYLNWDEVFKYTVFTRKEILEVIGECFDSKGKIVKRIPLLIWDDATFENQRQKKYDNFLEEFTKFYTIIRSVVANFVWTGPSFKLLPSKIQDLDWKLAFIMKLGPNKAGCEYYSMNTSPTGKTFLRGYKFRDRKVRELYEYTAIPPEIRTKYEIRRDNYAFIGFTRLKNAYNYMEKRKDLQETGFKNIVSVAKRMDKMYQDD